MQKDAACVLDNNTFLITKKKIITTMYQPTKNHRSFFYIFIVRGSSRRVFSKAPFFSWLSLDT